MRSADISGISPNFLELSQSRGQVAHVLLTRSPLEHPPEGEVSFDLHVLSTPPAFVLSQDQTLRRCLNPGENQELTLLISINPKKPTKGLLLGTDFRHAVEFSRSGRTRNPANPLALVRGGFSTLRHLPRESSPGVCDLGRPVSGGDPECNRRFSGSIPSTRPTAGRSAPGSTSGLRAVVPSPTPVSPGAERKLRGPRGRCQTG